MSSNVIKLSGTPRAIGFSHGVQLRSDILRLLGDECARVNCHLNHPVDESQIYDYARLFSQEIERELPVIYEEINGLADGAGISMDQAVLLQSRREIIMLANSGASQDCSTLSVPMCGRTIAQTIDLSGSFAEFGNVFKIDQGPGLPEILMYSFSGLLGYMGMNSHGLSIAINMVSSADWQLGVPPYLLVRHLLNLKDVDECIEALSSIKRSSSRCLTISDRYRSVVVEMTANVMDVIEGELLFHTNHYLSNKMQAFDTINFLAKNSSVQRLSRLKKLFFDLNKSPDINDFFGLFVDHESHPVGLCSHANGDKRRTESVATVVMRPSEGTMFVKHGLPCGNNEIEICKFHNDYVNDDFSLTVA